MLTDDYGPHVAYSHYIPIINALLLGRPVVICAQSIGPFRWTGWMARQLFGRAAAITLRDEISIGHLRAIGLDPGNAAVTADMAFLLQPASDTRAAEILRNEGIADDGDGSVLGVSVSRILERRYNLSRPRGASDFATLMAETLDRFASQTGCRVVFVSHVTGPSAVKDDRLIARDVAARMSAPCHVIQGDYRPEELKALIRRCRVFLGARMHANIAALSSGVPVVALAYSHKTPGIMALFGQGERVLNGPELSADGLFGQLSTAWATAPAIRERIESALPSVTAAALSNVGVIARLNGSREPLTA
jgi:colanic acid/amylovoran biosynthesis protein